MRLLIAVASLLFISGCTSFSHNAVRMESQTLETSPLQKVVIGTFNGSIKIQSHAESSVALEAHYKAYGSTEEIAEANCQQMESQIAANDGVLTIQATKPTGTWSSSTSYVLKVPKAVALELRTSNGRVEVAQVTGSVAIKTSNGRVEVKNIEGDVKVDTSNGRIVAQDIFGTVDLETSNGTVSLSGVFAGTGNQVRTSNGSIKLGLAPEAALTVAAQTSNGSLRCDMAGDRFQATGSKRKKTFAIGEGSSDTFLKLRTSNGSVTIFTAEPTDPAEVMPSEIDSSDFDKPEIAL